MRRKAGRQFHLGERDADHAGLADEDADVVECRPVLRQKSRLEPAKLRGSFRHRFLLLGNNQQTVAGAEHDVVGWNHIAAAVRTMVTWTPAGRSRLSSPSVRPAPPAPSVISP